MNIRRPPLHAVNQEEEIEKRHRLRHETIDPRKKKEGGGKKHCAPEKKRQQKINGP